MCAVRRGWDVCVGRESDVRDGCCEVGERCLCVTREWCERCVCVCVMREWCESQMCVARERCE